MKQVFESCYYYTQTNGKRLANPLRVRRSVGERWLARSFEQVEAVAHTGNGLVDLWEASPVRLDSNTPKTGEIIDILFPGNPLLCCGWTRHHFNTRSRAHWYNLHELQFIVPNP